MLCLVIYGYWVPVLFSLFLWDLKVCHGHATLKQFAALIRLFMESYTGECFESIPPITTHP